MCARGRSIKAQSAHLSTSSGGKLRARAYKIHLSRVCAIGAPGARNVRQARTKSLFSWSTRAHAHARQLNSTIFLELRFIYLAAVQGQAAHQGAFIARLLGVKRVKRIFCG